MHLFSRNDLFGSLRDDLEQTQNQMVTDTVYYVRLKLSKGHYEYEASLSSSSNSDLCFYLMYNTNLDDLATAMLMETLVGYLVVEDLETEGYSGVDASLEVSLIEYGLALKRNPDTKNYSVIFKAVCQEDDDNCYQIRKELTEKDLVGCADNESFGWRSFSIFIGLSKEQWVRNSLICKLQDLLQYYGWQNIFGG